MDHASKPPQPRAFGSVVAAGVAGAALVAVAGHQPWAHGTAPGARAGLTSAEEAGRAPAATALALVVLACWGVLLVTRGSIRRVAAVLASLAALGIVAAIVVGFGSAPDAVRSAYRDLGVTGPDVSRSGWFWVAAFGALITVLATLAAVRLVPSWPEMGRRYDAPAQGASAERPAEPAAQENLDLWKAIDEGRDPTA
jgi:uncharacterized membrane protein (TIGR02234 family)